MSQALTIGAETGLLDPRADAETPPDLDLLTLTDWTPQVVLHVAGPGDVLGGPERRREAFAGTLVIRRLRAEALVRLAALGGAAHARAGIGMTISRRRLQARW